MKSLSWRHDQQNNDIYSYSYLSYSTVSPQSNNQQVPELGPGLGDIDTVSSIKSI